MICSGLTSTESVVKLQSLVPSVSLDTLDLYVLFVVGDIPYKGYTPGQVVNEPFAWPQDHDQVRCALSQSFVRFHSSL